MSEDLREALERALAGARADLGALEDGRETHSPDRSIGRLSRLEALNDEGVRNTRIAQQRRRLQALEAALERVDDPDFGCCVDCDEPIALARLLLVPEARVCVACAEAREG